MWKITQHHPAIARNARSVVLYQQGCRLIMKSILTTVVVLAGMFLVVISIPVGMAISATREQKCKQNVLLPKTMKLKLLRITAALAILINGSLFYVNFIWYHPLSVEQVFLHAGSISFVTQGTSRAPEDTNVGMPSDVIKSLRAPNKLIASYIPKGKPDCFIKIWFDPDYHPMIYRFAYYSDQGIFGQPHRGTFDRRPDWHYAPKPLRDWVAASKMDFSR
ncbi:hypothetical protein [Capsulimonas corticalis]|uniref:hypothetical protein n=1 Tax=Capsulimonas corticalis TaxID=2219043 RepID=UPI000E659227|nr:hypothetical protein [Capsulimonas corticalis]